MKLKIALSFLSIFFLTNVFAQVDRSSEFEEINRSFLARLELRQQVTKENVIELQKHMTSMRYKEDQLGEKLIGFEEIGVTDRSGPAFAGSVGVNLNPSYSQLDFQSGDVLLLRGMSTISTSIATMTETPSQFSHTLILYVDASTGKTYGVESLLDKGMVVRSLEEILSEGVPRMVLYRNVDSVLAKRAGKIAYDTAMERINRGEHYPYDFRLNMNDYSHIYCAELIRMSYDYASRGVIKIPLYPSVVGPKMKATMNSLKVPYFASELYAPSDIDLEKGFDLVAEWKDYRATLNYRIKDQILLKVEQWVEEGAKEIDYSKILALAKSQAKGADGAALDLAKLNVYSNYINEMVNRLTIEILQVNKINRARTGQNMSIEEIQIYLETVREKTFTGQLLKNRGIPLPVSGGPRCSQVFSSR